MLYNNNDMDSQSTAESIDLTNTTQDTYYTDNISSQFRNDINIFDNYNTDEDSDGDNSLDLTNNNNNRSDNFNSRANTSENESIQQYIPNPLDDLVTDDISEEALIAMGIDINEIRAQKEIERRLEMEAKQLEYAKQVQEQLDREARSTGNNNNNNTANTSINFNNNINNNNTTNTHPQFVSNRNNEQLQTNLNAFIKGKRSIDILENSNKRPKSDLANGSHSYSRNIMNQNGESSSSALITRPSSSNKPDIFVIDSDDDQLVDLTDDDHYGYGDGLHMNGYYNVDEEEDEEDEDMIYGNQNAHMIIHQLNLLKQRQDAEKRYGLTFTGIRPFQYNKSVVAYNNTSSSDYLSASQAAEELRKLLESIDDDEPPPPEGRIGTPEGLAVTLLEHQKIGFQWMKKQEESNNKGGMLLDDMGLGKTIQALAIMVDRRCQVMDDIPDDKPKDTKGIKSKNKNKTKINWPETPLKIKATLVVCPVSLIEQWAQEVEFKTQNLSVLIYHGPKRTKYISDLAKYDVIITSYSIVGIDFHENALLQGPLKHVKLHRVILDEAHTIKNKNTKGSKACSELHSDYRWCLTATPIQNNIDELFSLIRFLKIKPYCDWGHFRDEISKKIKISDLQVCKKVQVILKAISLRRTKKAEIDGRPILNLPERNVHMTHVDFAPNEREFYNDVQTSVLKRFEEMVRTGTVMKRYSSVLVLLLRLRQACLHPNLIKDAKHEQVEDKDQQEKSAVNLDSKVIERLLESKDELETSECPICMDACDNPQIIAHCGHIMCKECMSNYLNSTNSYGAPKTCPQCRGDMNPNEIFPVEIFYKIHVPELYNNDEKVKSEQLLEDIEALNRFVSSKKIDTMMEILQKTKEDTRGQDKTIVFSQFTSMLDIIEEPLNQNGIKFGRYDGSMSLSSRTKMIDEFYNNPEMKVLIVSTKCGSLGLNLTMANRVILLDVWWNPALENQAIDRVHRIGQTKDVEVHRIFIKDTVEDRILALQRQKQDLADSALGEGKAPKLGRLNFQELLYLFRGGNAPTIPS